MGISLQKRKGAPSERSHGKKRAVIVRHRPMKGATKAALESIHIKEHIEKMSGV